MFTAKTRKALLANLLWEAAVAEPGQGRGLILLSLGTFFCFRVVGCWMYGLLLVVLMDIKKRGCGKDFS